MINELSASTSPQFKGGNTLSAEGVFTSVWRSDERGRIVLEIPLVDAHDVDRNIQLKAISSDGVQSRSLELRVQPPTLVLPAADGFARPLAAGRPAAVARDPG